MSSALILKSWTKSDFRKQKKLNTNIRKIVFYTQNSKLARDKIKTLLPKINKFDTKLQEFARSSDRIKSFSSSFSRDEVGVEGDIVRAFESVLEVTEIILIIAIGGGVAAAATATAVEVAAVKVTTVEAVLAAKAKAAGGVVSGTASKAKVFKMVFVGVRVGVGDGDVGEISTMQTFSKNCKNIGKLKIE